MKTLIFATLVAFSLCTLSAVVFFGALHHVITFLYSVSSALYLYRDRDGGASPRFVLLRMLARFNRCASASQTKSILKPNTNLL